MIIGILIMSLYMPCKLYRTVPRLEQSLVWCRCELIVDYSNDRCISLNPRIPPDQVLNEFSVVCKVLVPDGRELEGIFILILGWWSVRSSSM